MDGTTTETNAKKQHIPRYMICPNTLPSVFNTLDLSLVVATP
jgi:hypothetical protein